MTTSPGAPLGGIAQQTAPRTAAEKLADHLFHGAGRGRVADDVAAWLAASARFRAFVEAHSDKIRKKLRGATDAEALRDVRAELQAANLLLADRRVELAFEAYGSGKAGPDFTVAFRGERHFNVEVTRLRGEPSPARLGGSLLLKLRQLPPCVPNAVLVVIDGASAEELDVAAVTRTLRARADVKDEPFFVSRGLEGTRGFYERYLRLGAVLVWCEGAAGDGRATLWMNRSARIALPDRAARACLQCLRAGDR